MSQTSQNYCNITGRWENFNIDKEAEKLSNNSSSGRTKTNIEFLQSFWQFLHVSIKLTYHNFYCVTWTWNKKITPSLPAQSVTREETNMNIAQLNPVKKAGLQWL